MEAKSALPTVRRPSVETTGAAEAAGNASMAWSAPKREPAFRPDAFPVVKEKRAETTGVGAFAESAGPEVPA